MIRARDLAERVFWTFIAGFISALLGAPVVVAVLEATADTTINLSALGATLVAATFAGLAAAANVILVIARWRLSVLPNPGAGLPGLPAHDRGATTLELAFGAAIATFTMVLGALLLLG